MSRNTEMFGEHHLDTPELSPSILVEIVEAGRAALGEPTLKIEPLISLPFVVGGDSDGYGGPPVSDPLLLDVTAYISNDRRECFTGCTAWRLDFREELEREITDAVNEDSRNRERAIILLLVLRDYADQLAHRLRAEAKP